MYLIQSNADDKLISNCLHSDVFFNHLDSKQLTVKNISFNEALVRKWNNPDEAILLIHSFKDWEYELWTNFVENIQVPLFVIPTEFNTDELFNIITFGHKNISKIIVCSEYYQKYFLKVLKFDSNKIKLIYLPTNVISPPKMLRKPKPKQDFEQKVILSPSLMTEDKDYEILLMAARQLKFKYRNIIFALYLKSHPRLTPEENEKIITGIHTKALMLGLGPNIRILLDTKHPYQSYLKIADAVVIPLQYNNDMYSGTLIDAIVAHKAIVTPDTKLAYDLCKKDAGIYLYTTVKEIKEISDVEISELDTLPINDSSVAVIAKSKPQVVPMTQNEIAACIVDNCTLILDSVDIKDIMEEQNSILAENYSFSKIAQQYSNLIKRFKNS